MNKTAFTFDQASRACQEYQHLCGRTFDEHIIGKGVIECVAIAPFEEGKQWQFSEYYKEYRNALKALQFYAGHQFEVLVLALPLLRKRTIHYCDLRTYLTTNNVPLSLTLWDPYKLA